MKQFKTILLTLCLTLMAGLFLFNYAEAATTINSGQCGTNVTWKLDSAGTLTISGTGSMLDYSGSSSTSRAPWYVNRNAIKEVLIKDEVTAIGSYAFFGCYNVENVSFGKGLTSIGNCAFLSCNLTEVTLPSSITFVGDGAFSYCSRLTAITVNSTNYTSVDGVLYNENCTVLLQCPAGKSGDYTILEHVSRIENFAFAGCSKITSVTIPNSMLTIEEYAFDECENLTDIWYCGSEDQWDKNIGGESKMTSVLRYMAGTCGSGVSWTFDKTYVLTIFGAGKMNDSFVKADESCSSPWDSFRTRIKTVVVCDGVTSIGMYAFFSCSELTSITLPASVNDIGYGAFIHCSKLSDVYYAASESCWKTILGNQNLKGVSWKYALDYVFPVVTETDITVIAAQSGYDGLIAYIAVYGKEKNLIDIASVVLPKGEEKNLVMKRTPETETCKVFLMEGTMPVAPVSKIKL